MGDQSIIDMARVRAARAMFTRRYRVSRLEIARAFPEWSMEEIRDILHRTTATPLGKTLERLEFGDRICGRLRMADVDPPPYWRSPL